MRSRRPSQPGQVQPPGSSLRPPGQATRGGVRGGLGPAAVPAARPRAVDSILGRAGPRGAARCGAVSRWAEQGRARQPSGPARPGLDRKPEPLRGPRHGPSGPAGLALAPPDLVDWLQQGLAITAGPPKPLPGSIWRLLEALASSLAQPAHPTSPLLRTQGAGAKVGRQMAPPRP